MRRLLLLVSLPLSINLQAQMGAMTGCSYPARKLVSVTDTVPSSFTFTDVTNANISTVYTSNTITVSGINTPTHISISGGTFNVNSGSYGSTKTTVSNGDVVSIRNTSSGSFSTTVNSVLTIGGVTDTYSITTVSLDSVPNAFVFTDVTGATTSTVYTSNTVTISGMNSAATIRITGGTYSKNGGGYVSAQGTINNGDNVSVRVTSSSSSSTAVNATVTIGGVSDAYTVTTGAAPPAFTLDSVKSYFDRVYLSRDAKTNRAGTLQAVQGDDVLSIKETAQNTGSRAEFTTGTPTNPITGGTQSSTFAVPGVGTRTYPKYDTAYGGSVDIFNGRNKYYESIHADVGLPLEMWLITRTKPTIVYEFEASGFGGFGWRRNTFGALLQWAGQSSEYTRANDGTSFPNIMELAVMHFVMHSNKTMAVRMTDSRGDLVFQDSLTIGSGTYYMRNQYFGSNGHPDNFDFGGALIKYGELNPSQRTKILNGLKTYYPIGLKPDKPHCIPTIATSGSGSGVTWTVTLNYNNAGTGSAIDLSATTIRWYYADQNAAYSGGNWLDFQGIIRTTDANTLSLTRTLANTLTGGRYVIPGDNNTLMSVDADCYSLSGLHHKPVPSAPVYNNQP